MGTYDAEAETPEMPQESSTSPPVAEVDNSSDEEVAPAKPASKSKKNNKKEKARKMAEQLLNEDSDAQDSEDNNDETASSKSKKKTKSKKNESSGEESDKDSESVSGRRSLEYEEVVAAVAGFCGTEIGRRKTLTSMLSFVGKRKNDILQRRFKQLNTCEKFI